MRVPHLFRGTLCALLAALVLPSLLSGCGSSVRHGLSPSSPTVVTLWHYYNGGQKNAFDEMITEFNVTEGRELGIVVQASSLGSVNDLADSVLASAEKRAGAEALPNLFATYVDTALTVEKMGLLASLDGYLTGEELDEYFPSYIAEGRLGASDALMIFPIAKSTEILVLNRTDWAPFAADTGASTDDLATWEGLTDTAQRYYEYTGGQAFLARDAVANYMLVGSAQLGADIFRISGDGQVSVELNETAMRRLWDNLYIPYVNGWFAKHGRFASDDAKTGDVIATVCSSTGVTYFPSKIERANRPAYPVEGLVLPLPNFAGTDPYTVQQGAGMAVTRSDEAHEYAAVVFLKWFTEATRNTVFAVESGYLPVKREAGSYDAVTQVCAQLELELPPLMDQSIRVALDQCANSTLYASHPFDRGLEARNILENSMMDWAQRDLRRIALLERSGVPHGEAVARYATEENFSAWMSDLNVQLRALWM